MKEYYFEKLDVWKEARSFIKSIYIQTSNFSLDEKFGIISQIRQTSLSIMANIAKGMLRNSDKEKARFFNIAYGSTVETISFLVFVFHLELLSEAKYTSLRSQCEGITNKLNSLHKALIR